MALHYPPLTRNVGCFVTIATTLAVCALLGVTGVAAGPEYLTRYLGTIGGHQAVPVAVNNQGEVTGYASTPGDANWHAFLFTGSSRLDLGVLYEGENSYSTGVAINDNGQVVGRANSPLGPEHAFLWDRTSGMRDLGTLGGWGSFPTGINASGVVVGTASTPDELGHAFRYENGAMQDLGTLGGAYSWGTGVNSAGSVTGSADTADFVRHAFRYARGSMQDLGTLAAPYDRTSFGMAINDRGDVTGLSCSNERCHVFLFTDGTGMVDITPAVTGWPTPIGLSRSGQVSMVYQSEDGLEHTLHYSDGALTDIGHFGGVFTRPLGVSATGDIVGISAALDGLFHPFHYRDGVLTDLTDATSAGNGLALGMAAAVNDLGQIAVLGSVPHDKQHGSRREAPYLLTPVAPR